MRKLNPNIILFFVVIAVAGYAYFIEYKGNQKKLEQEAQAKKIFQIMPDLVTEFVVNTPNHAYRLKKENDKWYVLEPLKDRGSSIQVPSFLSQLFSEKFEEVVAEGPTIDFGVYGLDRNASSIEFITSQQTIKVLVGTASGLGGRRYLRINDEARVLLGTYTWESQLRKNVNELRDKNLIPSEYIVSKFSIFSPHGQLDFEKGEKDWRLKQLKKEPNQEAIDNMYIQVKNAKAKEIVTDFNRKNNSDFEKYKLNHPEIEIIAFSPEKKKVSLKFSKDINGKRYVISNERDCIFSLDATAVDVFSKKIVDFEKIEEPVKTPSKTMTPSQAVIQ